MEIGKKLNADGVTIDPVTYKHGDIMVVALSDYERALHAYLKLSQAKASLGVEPVASIASTLELCDCDERSEKCALGFPRTLGTASFSRCVTKRGITIPASPTPSVDLPAATHIEDCVVHSDSSGVCRRGTKSCTVVHAATQGGERDAAIEKATKV